MSQHQDHDLMVTFARAAQDALNAGFAHAAEADPGHYATLMQLIAEERCLPRMTVTWDKFYAVIDVHAFGLTDDGEEVIEPLFTYRLARSNERPTN